MISMSVSHIPDVEYSLATAQVISYNIYNICVSILDGGINPFIIWINVFFRDVEKLRKDTSFSLKLTNINSFFLSVPTPAGYIT